MVGGPDAARSTSPRDKVLESSVTRAAARPETTTLTKDKDATQDDPTELLDDADDENALDDDIDRLARMVAVLTRTESIELLTLLMSSQRTRDVEPRIYSFLLASQDNLQTFARLVLDDALILTQGRLTVSPVVERILTGLAKS
jgi:hypothetical protein